MKYLTQEELQELATQLDDSPNNVKTLVELAETLVNIYTRRFYFYNDFNNELPFIRDAFKDAIREQVKYFRAENVTTLEGLNEEPQTLTIGRTTISNGSRYSNSGHTNTKRIACIGFIDNLTATGRMWRGVDA